MATTAMHTSVLRDRTNSSPTPHGPPEQSQPLDESAPNQQRSFGMEPYNLRSWSNLREVVHNAERVSSGAAIDTLSETVSSTAASAVLHSTSDPRHHAFWPGNLINRREKFDVFLSQKEGKDPAGIGSETAFLSPNAASNQRAEELSSLEIQRRVGETSGNHMRGGNEPIPPRSLFLNDLECKAKPSCEHLFPHKQRSSSSSGELLRNINILPSYPLRPTHSPPFRKPTPPGLPAFETTEAQELRLTPSSRPEWFDALIARLRRLGETGEDSDGLQNCQTRISPTTSPPEVSGSSAVDTREGLKRLLGMPRPVARPPDFTAPRRISLPRGVRVAAIPGALIRADDGSMVRGRFPYRASGHGIGARPIDAHPFYQRSEMSGCEQPVTDIEKDIGRAEVSRIQLNCRTSPNELLRIPTNNLASTSATGPTHVGETFSAASATSSGHQRHTACEVERRCSLCFPSSAQCSQTRISQCTNQGDISSTRLPDQPSPVLLYPSPLEPSNLTNRPIRTRSHRPRPVKADQSLSPSLMREPRLYRLSNSSPSVNHNSAGGTEQVPNLYSCERTAQQFERRKTWHEKYDVCWEWTCGPYCCCCYSGARNGT